MVSNKAFIFHDKAFIFHMCIPCSKSFSLVPRSRPYAKVKYQGQVFTKNGHILFLYGCQDVSSSVTLTNINILLLIQKHKK